MLVDVVLMRFEGRKYPKESLPGLTKIRGHLHVWSYLEQSKAWEADAPAGGRLQAASLTEGPEFSSRTLLALDAVRLTRLDASGMVLTGAELLGTPAQGKRCPQAWWIRLVGASEGPAPYPRGQA